ncbi:hypothetical protein [Capnocytophaga sp.]|uniref:hypothetical protein n=1 Tax=Capnocytophaga sp. TaxID=44737 RepID=UPI0026DBBC81|nr:hypothetical protein [Capnocytophaga sp.]MDO5106136.1 hypothetical protein [Capnocytophaga sp.]
MGHYLNTENYLDIYPYEVLDEQVKHHLENLDILDRVQFSGTFYKKSQLPQLKKALQKTYNELILRNKSVQLRFYGFTDTPFDMDWIADLTEIECLEIESWSEILHIEKLADFKNLKKLHLSFGLKMKGDLSFLTKINPNLEVLYIRTEEKKPKVDLMPVTHFKNLKELWVMYLENNLENALAELPHLQKLRLRSISKPQTLDFIKHLTDLQHLNLELCSFSDVSAIGELKNLRSLNLFRLLKVEDLSFLSDLQQLTFIELDSMSNLHTLPRFTKLKNNCEIKINSCKKITDFTALADSTMIKAISITTAPNLSTEQYILILQNPHIEYVSIYTESAKRNTELNDLAQKFGKKPYRERYQH